ncbi:phosphoserine phosphatase SerB [Aliiglaciecola lipolytica]|uniref:Phosphoserine phosphatase n=1 Tax=Aliiglaciecola lipolytica E3 TaxID=1127673 RepID=K6YER3_9ALTE|nr:phosphoserine phosphatase SerB [Aliiglaciecola lipolytica]GAC15133.1 phosphoserine phosphatase [Aliiglaciecola lipolytica E3]
MLTTKLSTQEWLSAKFLTNLHHKNVSFVLPEAHQVELTENPDAASQQLILFSESLNLEKLYQIQGALAEALKVTVYQPGYQGNNGCAIDAQVTVLDSSNLPALIETVAVRFQVDISLLEKRPTLTKPGLLLMDMDSTVIGIECIDEIAKLAGVGKQVSEVTELAMQGKLDFAQSLTSRVACLAGADESILKTVRDNVPINLGISRLLAELKNANWKLAIASGGFTYFADYLAQRLDLDFAISNQLEIVDGKLTGKVLGEIIGAQSKADTLNMLAEKYAIEKSQTIALGDGANDLVMMAQAGLGVAYHAKPVVRQQADAALRFCAADGLLALLTTNEQ